MKIKLTFLLLIIFQFGFSQQYDTVVTEDENIDKNNEIYKTGNVFVYDYEIIQDGERCKLKKNNGMFARSEFELVSIGTDSIEVDPDGARLYRVPKTIILLDHFLLTKASRYAI